jgi:hypothetical protein
MHLARTDMSCRSNAAGAARVTLSAISAMCVKPFFPMTERAVVLQTVRSSISLGSPLRVDNVAVGFCPDVTSTSNTVERDVHLNTIPENFLTVDRARSPADLQHAGSPGFPRFDLGHNRTMVRLQQAKRSKSRGHRKLAGCPTTASSTVKW